MVALLQQEMSAPGMPHRKASLRRKTSLRYSFPYSFPIPQTWRVRCRSGLAACACIGSGFTVDPMSPARAITALARERIPVVTQGASELGITLIVEDADSERALRCLHRDLIAPVIPLVRHTVEEKRREAL